MEVIVWSPYIKGRDSGGEDRFRDEFSRASSEPDLPGIDFAADGEACVHPGTAGHEVGVVLLVEVHEESGDESPEFFASRGVAVDLLNPVPIWEGHAVDSLQGLLLGCGLIKDALNIGLQGFDGLDPKASPMVSALVFEPVRSQYKGIHGGDLHVGMMNLGRVGRIGRLCTKLSNTKMTSL